MSKSADPQAATSGEPSYNPIFEHFVPPGAHGDRLGGLIAYSLYKVAKREWAAEIWRTERRAPTESDLAAYIRTWTPTRLEGLKQEADNALATFSDIVIQAERPNIREEALRGTFWSNVRTSVSANFLYTMLLIATVILLSWSGIDFLELLSKAKPHQ